MEWTERVEQLLYDGETETRRVAVGDATIVITSHRVLAFTPGEGARYRAVDRPNVGQITVDSTGRTRALAWTALFGLVALSSAALAVLYSFADLVPDLDIGDADGEATPGDDPAGEPFALLETTLAALDLAVVAVALLSALVAAGFLVRYVRSRARRVVIEVHGDEDLEIPLSTGAVGTAVVELRTAIGPEPTLEEESFEPTREPPTESGPLEAGGDVGDDLESAPSRGSERDPAFLERDDGIDGSRDASLRGAGESHGTEPDALEPERPTDGDTEETGAFVFGDRTRENSPERRASADEPVAEADTTAVDEESSGDDDANA